MSDKPTDAVAQAREMVLACGGINWREDTNAALDVLIAAVRAECAAKVRTVGDCHAHCLERRANVDHIAELEAEVERLRAEARGEPSEAMVEAAAKSLIIGVNGLTEKGWRNEGNDPLLNDIKNEAMDAARRALTSALAAQREQTP